MENQYARSVAKDGNVPAIAMVQNIFEVVSRKWRGVGPIAQSGLRLKEEFRAFDAEIKFDVGQVEAEESAECISGLILQGIRKPCECPAFASRCTPEHPLGATMVSSEGACAAYYRYRNIPHPARV